MDRMIPVPYSRPPSDVATIGARNVAVFEDRTDSNRDTAVIESFGEEWNQFHAFDEAELARIASDYFDLIDASVVNKETYAIDIGCGTGRFSKALAPRVGFIEAVDPSDSLQAADKLLKGVPNVRLTKASVENLPFSDETFDFAMSVGVLHHIPDTEKALRTCVAKVKRGGYFYVYLYYALDNRGPAFRALFRAVDAVRRTVSRLPSTWKQITCDALAVGVYMPPVWIGRALRAAGYSELSRRLPLSYYQTKSFYIIRNDARDRFGTSLEHRFSRREVVEMMHRAGLVDVTVSEKMPYWHAIGRKP